MNPPQKSSATPILSYATPAVPGGPRPGLAWEIAAGRLRVWSQPPSFARFVADTLGDASFRTILPLALYLVVDPDARFTIYGLLLLSLIILGSAGTVIIATIVRSATTINLDLDGDALTITHLRGQPTTIPLDQIARVDILPRTVGFFIRQNHADLRVVLTTGSRIRMNWAHPAADATNLAAALGDILDSRWSAKDNENQVQLNMPAPQGPILAYATPQTPVRGVVCQQGPSSVRVLVRAPSIWLYLVGSVAKSGIAMFFVIGLLTCLVGVLRLQEIAFAFLMLLSLLLPLMIFVRGWKIRQKSVVSLTLDLESLTLEMLSGHRRSLPRSHVLNVSVQSIGITVDIPRPQVVAYLQLRLRDGEILDLFRGERYDQLCTAADAINNLLRAAALAPQT